MTILLKGMTWDHPRGFDPLVACSQAWEQRTGVRIEWDKRSLQDFEAYPVKELASRYDLIVIDHPHVGQITAEHCLQPLDDDAYAAQLRDLAAGSVGRSLDSYRWQGRQWALPIDAATQVQAWMPDGMAAPAQTWDDVLALARRGALLCPMRAPHSLMVLYTLAAHLGCVANEAGPDLFDAAALTPILERMAELAALLPPSCWGMDPIDVFEQLSAPQSPYLCAPYIYGYVNYAWNGFRPRRVAFADMPILQGGLPAGSALGGTGIAVSAVGQHVAQAVAFAYWVASAEIQRTVYAQAGGQPGHAAAWEDDAVNAQAGNFYRDTRRTLEHAWVRPRHDGYMAFQQQASAWLNQALQDGRPARRIADELNLLYRAHKESGA